MPSDMTTAAETLRLYRTAHRIVAVDGRCQTDGIRVWPVKGGRLRHDPGDIVKLMDATYGEAWPTPAERESAAAVEVARDMIREDFGPDARRDAFEEGRLTFEWHGHAVDVDLS